MMEVNNPLSFFSLQGLIRQQRLRSWLTLLIVKLGEKKRFVKFTIYKYRNLYFKHALAAR